MPALSQMVPPGCIQANPDIAGIGVRVAIYAQNFLSLTLAIVALGNRHVSWKEMLTVEIQSMSVLLTACALLLSAVVQAATFGMSTYHALVVLNLAWMNNTNTLVYAILFRYQRATNAPASPYWAGGAAGEIPPKRKAFPLLAIGSLHLSFAAGFGLWFWTKVQTFGASAQCTPEIPVSLVIFGHAVLVNNRALQRVSLATYSIIAAPGLNLAVAVGAIYGLATLCGRLGQLFFRISTSAAFFAPGYISVALLVGINVVIATDTETMINQTKGLVQPGESQWTFGQTLAIFLLILPLRDIFLTLFGREPGLAPKNMAQDKRCTAKKRAKKRCKEKQTPSLRPERPITTPLRQGSRPTHRLTMRQRPPNRPPFFHRSPPRTPATFPMLPILPQIITSPSFTTPPIPPLQTVPLASSPLDSASTSLESLYWRQHALYRSHSIRSSWWTSSSRRSPDLYSPSPLSHPPSLTTLTRSRSQSLPPTPSSTISNLLSRMPMSTSPISPMDPFFI